MKTGKKASAEAARKRGTVASESSQEPGTRPATSRPTNSNENSSPGRADPRSPLDLDRGQDRQQDAGEHERVDEPGRAEQQRELHDGLGLEQQEPRAHEEQVEVAAHRAELPAGEADRDGAETSRISPSVHR